MTKKGLLIIIPLLILLFVSGCRSNREKPVSPINQPTQNNSQNENDGKDQPVQDNTVKPQPPVEDKMVTDSQLKISYTEDVLVFTFTDKDVETFFQLVDENDERELEIQFNLGYKFNAGVRFLAADPSNNHPSEIVPNYENHIYNRNGNIEWIYAESRNNDSWKVDWEREGKTISIICKAHGLPASEVQGAAVDLMMIGLMGYERDITPRRTITSDKISYSDTLPEGADRPIQIPVTSSLSDFKLLGRYKPKSDDYLLVEMHRENFTQLHVVSYDERGMVMDNAIITDPPNLYTNMKEIETGGETQYSSKEQVAYSGVFSEEPSGTEFNLHYLSKPTLTAKQMHHLGPQ